MLDTSVLRSILSDWSFWTRQPPNSIQRRVNLPPLLEQDLALMIQGVRRGGKSTLLSQLPQHYKLDQRRCYYCNFEDPRLADNLTHDLLIDIVALAREEHGMNADCYFFFDEIQGVKNWEKFLHMELALHKRNFFVVTGSNSALLSGELGSSLTGRHITITLYPFSFPEFKSLLPGKDISDYLLLGGFPKALTSSQPRQLLQEYFMDITYTPLWPF